MQRFGDKQVIGVMMISLALAGLATWAWSAGWFKWLLLVEGIVVVVLYAGMRASLASVRWSPLQ